MSGSTSKVSSDVSSVEAVGLDGSVEVIHD